MKMGTKSLNLWKKGSGEGEMGAQGRKWGPHEVVVSCDPPEKADVEVQEWFRLEGQGAVEGGNIMLLA
ncbi:hypothetical protein ACH5RR_035564 [Cinchona calisaya]|uniref:Uncharacterized protein n=1 Tax=Cinchona calisaya TaxID=153742 RepID=A0ABD2Y5M3_9GENT